MKFQLERRYGPKTLDDHYYSSLVYPTCGQKHTTITKGWVVVLALTYPTKRMCDIYVLSQMCVYTSYFFITQLTLHP